MLGVAGKQEPSKSVENKTMPPQRNGANFDSEKSTVSLRQYVESLVKELEKRTDAQFLAAKEAVAAALAAAEKAVAAALVASDKLTAAAFVAAKEALAEAQTQLTAYKAASNEWRATLNDVMSKIMVRQEVEALFKSAEDKMDTLEKRVVAMEGQGMRTVGQEEAQSAAQVHNRWTIEKVLSIIALLLAFGAFFWKTK
jgi:hypothetical protein